MTGYTNDFNAFAVVAPRALHAYLVAQGWHRVEPYGNTGDVYGLEGARRELLVPASSGFADYQLRISQILEILSLVEERDSRAILRDLSLADYDLVRVRLPEAGADGSLPIDSGVTLFQESRNLLLASACSASRPQRAFRAGRNQQASNYLHTVRLGQTEQGSFVVNLLSPVPPNLAGQPNSYAELASEPFPRKVTRKLVSGLKSASEAVDSVNRGSDIQAFEQKVPQGVSANLCDALANLLNYENSEHLDISVSWSLTRKPPEDRAQVRFNTPDASILREASRILKDRQERPDERVAGYVTSLTREQLEHRGRATIKAVIDEVMSSVRVDFRPHDYSRITLAHDERRVVSLEGDLRREGQRWVLENPRDLEVLEDD